MFDRKEDLFMKLVGGAGPELLATFQRNLPEFSPSLIQRLAKGIELLVQVGDKYEIRLF